jgi:ribosome-binding ATPase YchF (GTP1/OBG family)
LALRALADRDGAELIVICAEAEAQIAELDPAERAEFLADLGLERSGLDALVTVAYRLLGLLTFFTAGPKEARAWTVRKGATAPRAAREIHSDIERGFIRAEVITYDDYAALGSEQAVKDVGKLRVEGRDYVMRDGDVVHFRFNV